MELLLDHTKVLLRRPQCATLSPGLVLPFDSRPTDRHPPGEVTTQRQKGIAGKVVAKPPRTEKARQLVINRKGRFGLLPRVTRHPTVACGRRSANRGNCSHFHSMAIRLRASPSPSVAPDCFGSD